MTLDGTYLPGPRLDDEPTEVLAFGKGDPSVRVNVRCLAAARLSEVATHVRDVGGPALRTLAVQDIVRAVDTAIHHLLNPQHPARQVLDAALPAITGFDAELLRLNLNAYLKTFRAPQLQRFLAEDFVNPAVLDRFQPGPKGGMTHVRGPALLAHVWAGNVPGLPLWSLISALLVKAPSVGKVASAEPLTAAVFARLLAEIEPRLASALAIVWFRGGDVARERALFSEADVVLAYGGDATLAALRQQVPAHARWLPHGHKISAGVVSAAALDAHQLADTARAAAMDVVRHEQQGCYAAHAFYVVRGGQASPRDFAQALAGQLSALALRYPPPAPELAEAASVAQWRQGMAMAGEEGVELLGPMDAGWAVAYRDTAHALLPTALHRSVVVQAVDHLEDVPAMLAPRRQHLQTVGLAVTPAELQVLALGLAEAGVTRLCGLGHMPAPEPGWHHDGRYSLLDLVRVVDLEGSAERVAERYAPYRD